MTVKRGRLQRPPQSKRKVQHLTKREPLAKRTYQSRRHRFTLVGGKGLAVDVWVTRSRIRMDQLCGQLHAQGLRPGDGCQACVLHRGHWRGPKRRQALWSRQLLATMYFNQYDMRRAPGELVTHEVTHVIAAMCRRLGIDQRQGDGEEASALAAGCLGQDLANLWANFYRCGDAVL